MTKLIGRHLRNNAVGYVALTVALGGTSYAATNPNAAARESESNGPRRTRPSAHQRERPGVGDRWSRRARRRERR